MRCIDVMKSELETVSPDDPVERAASKMRDASVGFMPVCDPNGRVVGTLTDRDITIRLVADGGLASTPVGAIMTRDLVGCAPDDDLEKAEDLMRKYHKSRVLVLDEAGQLRGVISLSDVAQAESDFRAGQMLRDVAERESHLH